MLNPMRHKSEGTYSGGKGTTPVTCDLSRRSLRVKASYELSWKKKRSTRYQVIVKLS